MGRREVSEPKPVRFGKEEPSHVERLFLSARAAAGASYLRRDAQLGVSIQHHLLQLRQAADLDRAELEVVFAQVDDLQLRPLVDVALQVHDAVLAQVQLAQLSAEA